MDLLKFKRKVSRKKKELQDFLEQLDEKVPEDFSTVVAEEDLAMWKEVNCTTCANCCKTMTPTYSKEDIKRIAHHLNMKPKEFFDKWLYIEEESGDTVNKTQPCQFLINDLCSIYDVRPVDCAEFPHHFKRPFDEYNDTYTQNLNKCPATFRLVERLNKRVKDEYEW